jgi:RES domain-containing protein
MRVWRIAKRQHAAFDGIGAFTYGGRWNSPGNRAVYTSTSLALAVLEVLVHLPGQKVPNNYVAIPADIPDQLRHDFYLVTALPTQWRSRAEHRALIRLGDAWIANGRAAVLRVPSALIPDEENVILNPNHPDFGQIMVQTPQPFRLDPRIVSLLDATPP